MHCEKITYTDYNGVERTEDFLFNLTKTEIMEMETSVDGGLSETMKKFVEKQNIPELMKLAKNLILRSYGEKSADGKHFKKSKEISEDFANTEAYSVLFMKLMTDADAASKFVNGIVPADLKDLVANQ